MNWIDYSVLPEATGGFSSIFNDYVNRFDSVKQFYSSDFRAMSSYEDAISHVEKKFQSRDRLTEILTQQNDFFCGDSASKKNIELLSRTTTFAIVTGQQVGLFGGPLYTIFKTITSIKLAEKLKKQFPQYDFVPVFWVEGEDHDFSEMNHVFTLDRENNVKRLEYLVDGEKQERNMGPVGELKFGASLKSVFEQLLAFLPESEFSKEIVAQLRACYCEGKTFTQSFVSWMNYLFAGYGLVFISPNNRDLKRLASPIFLKEISEFPRTSQLIIERSADLEKKYHAQIKPKSINLFLFHKGGRYLIQPRESDFSLKGTRHTMSTEELMHIATDQPELLSPNVVLRPIMQDTLLPTIAYVGGPSEIAYNAQLQPIYQMFGVPQPVVYPRASASFVVERATKTMAKYDVAIEEFFESTTDRITAGILDQVADVKLDSLFGEASTRMKHAIDELEFGLREVDQTLLPPLVSVEKKVEQSLDVLKAKAFDAQKRKNEIIVSQVERVSNTLLPNGQVQERLLSPVYFMNRYGPDLIQWLHDELDINAFKHQILTV